MIAAAGVLPLTILTSTFLFFPSFLFHATIGYLLLLVGDGLRESGVSTDLYHRAVYGLRDVFLTRCGWHGIHPVDERKTEYPLRSE